MTYHINKKAFSRPFNPNGDTEYILPKIDAGPGRLHIRQMSLTDQFGKQHVFRESKVFVEQGQDATKIDWSRLIDSFTTAVSEFFKLNDIGWE